MIRGVVRNAVIIDNPAGGKVFRQAIFLLKDGDDSRSDRELAEEAERIVAESTGLRRRRRTFR